MTEKLINGLKMGRLLCKAELGALSSEERHLLDKWLADSDEHRALAAKVGVAFKEFTGEKTIDADEAWRRFQRKYRLDRPRHIVLWSNVMKYAAVFVLLAALGATLYVLRKDYVAPELISYATDAGVELTLEDAKGIVSILEVAPEPKKTTPDVRIEFPVEDHTNSYEIPEVKEKDVKYTTVKVPRFGYYKMSLPDGSTAIFNSNAKLRYLMPFVSDKRNREVWLEGEAYFEIVANERAPFTVHFEGGQVTVLGTKFNVSASTERETVSVTLVEGSITCTTQTESRTLTPGFQALFDRESGEIVSNPVDVRVVIAWTQGRFYFKNNKLGDIIQELSKWYDVEIFFANPEVKEQIFTLEVNRYENLNRILDILSKTDRIEYTQRGRRVTISGK